MKRAVQAVYDLTKYARNSRILRTFHDAALHMPDGMVDDIVALAGREPEIAEKVLETLHEVRRLDGKWSQDELITVRRLGETPGFVQNLAHLLRLQGAHAISPVHLAKMIANPNLRSLVSPEALLADLGKLASAERPVTGINRLVRSLTSRSPQVAGRLYELEVAAKIVPDGLSVNGVPMFLSEIGTRLQLPPFGPLVGRRSSDMDLVLRAEDGSVVVASLKSSSGAFTSRYSRRLREVVQSSLQKEEEWCQVAAAWARDQADLGGRRNFNRVIYIVPRQVDIEQSLIDFFASPAGRNEPNVGVVTVMPMDTRSFGGL